MSEFVEGQVQILPAWRSQYMESLHSSLLEDPTWKITQWPIKIVTRRLQPRPFWLRIQCY